MLILEAQQQEEVQQYEQRIVGGLMEKSLNPTGKNNGSQAYKINKWVKINEPKGAQRKKQ